MRQTKRRSTLFRICIPLIVYYLAEYLGTVLAETYIMVKNAGMILEETGLADMTTANVQELTERMLPVLMKLGETYQVQIYGFAALCTIPVCLLFMRNDKKAEILEGRNAGNDTIQSIYYLYLPLLGIAACLAANCLAVMTTLVSADSAFQVTSEGVYAAPFPIQIICLGIILPVAEELIFRGVIYKRLRERVGFYFAMFSVSILFGMAHNNLVQLAYAIGLGLLLCYSFEKYNTIKASIILHVSANLFSLIMTKIGFWNWISSAFIRMGIAVIVSAFVGSLVFVNMQKIREINKLPTDVKINNNTNNTNTF